MYRLLLHEELCVCELAAVVGVSQSAVSQHLRRLKTVGLVRERRRGQWVFYRGNAAPLEELARSLMGYKTTAPQDQAELKEVWDRVLAVKRQNLCGLPSPEVRRGRTQVGALTGGDAKA